MLSMRASPAALVCAAGGTFSRNGVKLELDTRVSPFTRVRKNVPCDRQVSNVSLGLCRAKLAIGEKEATRLVTFPHEDSELLDFSTRFDTRTHLVGDRGTGNSRNKRRVIVIAGPTAVGKTRLSIELAKMMGGEIINADSVQVYQGLDIGAAKIPIDDREGIPHHLIDVVPPTVEYAYEQFLMDSRAATEKIFSKGLVPIVVGGTGMYMRWYMQNKQGITSHPFDGEDLTGDFSGTCSDTDWDYDFQCWFLYQHRADLYPRVDIRCEEMVPDLLKETSWLLDLGIEPQSNSAAKAIGYEEAMVLLLEARHSDGLITEDRFLTFLSQFQHHSKHLVRKQIAWFRNPARSEVRRFRWIQAAQPVEYMVDEIEEEYMSPSGKFKQTPDGMLLKAASLKEQKSLRTYKPTLKIFSDPAAIARTLEWIRRTQRHHRCRYVQPHFQLHI